MTLQVQDFPETTKAREVPVAPSASWHPFTQMKEFEQLPKVVVERGEGCWLEDVEGRRYLDGTASVWTNVHGHGHPELDAAIRTQLGKVAHSTYLGLSHGPALELETSLTGIAPEGLERVFFSDNGSNAVEIALKLSFQYWQLMGRPEKTEVLAMEGAYHGDTFGAMSVGGGGVFHGRFEPWCFPVHRFPRPSCRESGGVVDAESDEASVARLAELLGRKGDSLAAVILEPWIQGAAGMQLQPRTFVRKVSALCREHGVHLILDEVFTGFGRTGPMLVSLQTDVQPDFLCLAKGLTAGYLPLAATLATGSIYDAFLGEPAEHRQFFHGHTFTANPLGSAVALKNIELLKLMLEGDDFHARMEYFGSRVRALFLNHPNVAEVRQRGFTCALDLCPGDAPGRTFPIEARVGLKVALEARSLGLLLRPLADTLLLVPPLVISREEIDFLCTTTLQSIHLTFQHQDQSNP